MEFVIDPPVSEKIDKMKERVRWQDPRMLKRSIDQTSMVIDDGFSEESEFSFLVIGDTGSGPHPDHHPQRKIAELMKPYLGECRFLIHTGDVVYHVGSREYYPRNFIYPYQEFIVGGDKPNQISYERMVFEKPFLPVLGNHDYYDLPFVYGFLAQATWGIRHLLGQRLDLNIGWYGSDKGKAYAKAFLDYIEDFSDWELENHLERHYTAQWDSKRCLRYQPGLFTRLPNRYYTFNYGGIDFFALDSNTFNTPTAIPKSKAGESRREELISRHQFLERSKQEILEASSRLHPNRPEDADTLDDYQAQINQIDETILDIEKQLNGHQKERNVDFEQLDWLKDRLIASWHDPHVRGRVIFLHHPPYVTESNKWNQAQTLKVRQRLRQVLKIVAKKAGQVTQGRAIVDVVLSGHAHCLEHLYTTNSKQADAHIHWVICGAGGHSLRRQRSEGSILTENLSGGFQEVARSQLFVGRNGHGSQKRKPYSFLKVDVQAGNPARFVFRPFVAERYQHQWVEKELEPFIVNSER